MKPSEVAIQSIKELDEKIFPHPIKTTLAFITIALIESIKETIINHPKTFGITDKKGRGGAILVEDVIASLEAEKESIKNKML